MHLPRESPGVPALALPQVALPSPPPPRGGVLHKWAPMQRWHTISVLVLGVWSHVDQVLFAALDICHRFPGRLILNCVCLKGRAPNYPLPEMSR